MSHVTPVLLVHGGAGTPIDGKVDGEPEHHDALRAALLIGHELLTGGASAVDAVEAAVRSLEDCPLFNAGRGSVLTTGGGVELDAALMEGATRQAGSVAGLRLVRHPVSLARAVMEKTPHVMLIGEGAEAYARDSALEIVDPAWFVTDRELARQAAAAARAGANRAGGASHGTVGAVALDSSGSLAAATSTGGVRQQLPGRVGDAPLIGCGTWADGAVAVSCTGTGEEFIQAAAAHELSALVRHAGVPLGEAAPTAIAGLDGGCIALGADGSWAMPFNTALMYRGRAAEGALQTWIWNEEESNA